eukprot:CAMPEP_0179168124 /NCGR_PEP_ID=MMETSP0796-20121207/82689_1 /TAXON_ID=73915 /ORGANISM="Pyrodinium bahamense, Strain pbaha01" /LENGTH=33 /DNA_ID= /DNA_START= /DNA_END= /DNA_ORIENTATION=
MQKVTSHLAQPADTAEAGQTHAPHVRPVGLAAT